MREADRSEGGETARLQATDDYAVRAPLTCLHASGGRNTPAPVECVGVNRGLTDYWRAFRSFSPGARLYLWHTMLGSVAWSMVALLLNLYLYSLGYRQDFMGLVNALPAAVTMVLGLPVGSLADRYGYRIFLLVGATLTAAAGIGVALATTRSALLAWAALSGVGGTLTWVIGTPYLASQSDEANRMELLSVNFALMTAAGFVGSLLAGQIPQRFAAVLATDPMATGPLRAGMLAAGLLSALAVVPLLRLPPESSAGKGATATPSGVARPGWVLDRHEVGLFARILLPAALIGFGAGVMVTFFQIFFRLRFGLEPGQIGVIFAFTSIFNAIASLVTPLMARRIGKVRTVVATQLASIPFLLMLTFSYDLRWATIAYYARSALMNMGGPVSMAFALELVAPHRRAILSSLETMLGSLGRGGLGPLVSGFLQVRGGFEPAFTLTTLCYVAATGLFWWFFKDAERPQSLTTAMASTSKAAPRGKAATSTVERAGAGSEKNSA